MRKQNLVCPNCGSQHIDISKFSSMMVVSEQIAFFTVKCPGCGRLLSTVSAIPESLKEEVASAAMEIRTGMGEGTSSSC